MIGETNNNKNESFPIYNYQNLILWLDGTQYKDFSKNNYYVAPSGNGSSCNIPVTISNKASGHPSYYNSDTSSFIRIGNFDLPMDNLTITCWGNITTNTTWARYCDFGHASGGNSDIALGTGGGVLRCGGRQGSSGNSIDFYTPNGTCNASVWYFVAYSSNKNIFKGYINGSLQATRTTSWTFPTTNITTTNGLFLSNWNTSENGIGYITDFRLYDYTLTDAEILALYNQGPQHH